MRFITRNLSTILAVLIVLNVVIILFAMIGIGWNDIARIAPRLVEAMNSQSHINALHLDSASQAGRPADTATSKGGARTVAGVVSDPNLQLVCGDGSYGAAVGKVRPAIVSISSKSVETSSVRGGPQVSFDDTSQNLLDTGGLGTGIIIDSRGFILTCYHVVAQARQLEATVQADTIETLPAVLVAKDESLNLAVLRVNAGRELPVAALGDSSQLEVADYVLAIGSPFGLHQTVTHGIISDDRRDLAIAGIVYRGLIQTDAAINKGSSGGPLINLSGEVVGINMAIYSTTGVYNGVSFAMPVNQAKRLLAKAIE
jgi:S1-C subfamily serine protease